MWLSFPTCKTRMRAAPTDVARCWRPASSVQPCGCFWGEAVLHGNAWPGHAHLKERCTTSTQGTLGLVGWHQTDEQLHGLEEQVGAFPLDLIISSVLNQPLPAPGAALGLEGGRLLPPFAFSWVFSTLTPWVQHSSEPRQVVLRFALSPVGARHPHAFSHGRFLPACRTRSRGDPLLWIPFKNTSPLPSGTGPRSEPARICIDSQARQPHAINQGLNLPPGRGSQAGGIPRF